MTLRRDSTIAFLTFLLIGPALPGCLSFSTDISTSGAVVDEGDRDLLTPGKTNRQAVIELLGNPSRSVQTNDTTEILTYRSTVHHKSRACLVLLNAREEKRYLNSFHVELQDGVVTRTWEESQRVAKDSDVN